MSKCKLDLHKTFYMNWIGRTITCNNRFWPSPDFNTPCFQCFVKLFSLARRNSAVIFSQHDECGCFDLRRNSKIVTKQTRNRRPQALVTSNSNNTSNIPQKHKNNTKNNQTKNDVQTTRNTKIQTTVTRQNSGTIINKMNCYLYNNKRTVKIDCWAFLYQQPTKGKLLLLTYDQLCVEQYGETGLLGLKLVKLSILPMLFIQFA